MNAPENLRSDNPWNAFVERGRIAGAATGPLAGTTFAVKDNVAVAGQAFTAGHPLLAGRRATDTAPAVKSLLDAGASFIGMAQTDAGGFGASTPQTRNPAAPGLTVGGSSGGSAAAVAAGDCDFAVGTDTGGSVRIPAACTGLAGFKPSYGRVSNDGVWPLTPQLDHVGIIARDIDLLERAGRVLIGCDETAGSSLSAPLKIGIEIDRANLFDPGIAAELDEITALLAAAGHEVTRVPVPGRENIAEAHGVIVLSEAAAIYADLTADERGQLGTAAASALRHAESLSAEGVEAAWEWVRAVSGRMKTEMAPLDVLISPTLPVPPPPLEARRVAMGGDDVPVVVAMTLLTCLANLTGDPVVAFPYPNSAAKPATGIQLMGKAGTDEALFGIARRIHVDLAEATS